MNSYMYELYILVHIHYKNNWLVGDIIKERCVKTDVKETSAVYCFFNFIIKILKKKMNRLNCIKNYLRNLLK